MKRIIGPDHTIFKKKYTFFSTQFRELLPLFTYNCLVRYSDRLNDKNKEMSKKPQVIKIFDVISKNYLKNAEQNQNK